MRNTRTTQAAACLIAGVALFAAPSAHAAGAAQSWPTEWRQYAAFPDHNAVFGRQNTTRGHGVSWRFREADALPLNLPNGKDGDVLGARSGPVKTTQFLGNAVGVSVVSGTVYAESDDGYVYAVNALSGKERWRRRLDNFAMGNPLVVNGRLFVGTGDTGFSFSQVMRYAAGNHDVVRGLAWGGIYALDARTGKVLWRYGTKGEDMPSECFDRDTLYFGNGDGHAYALNPATGKPRWISKVGGFDSMSSCNVLDGKIYLGFTNPNDIVALDERNGKIVWRAGFPEVANTGMGDNSPTIDPSRKQVIQVAIASAKKSAGKATVDTEVIALDAASGALKWKQSLGRGPVPPAYKAGIAMVHDGVVYVGSDVTQRLYALSASDGRIIWNSDIPHHTKPGLGRGGLAYVDGRLYEATGPSIYVWDARSGKLIHEHYVGGRFSIANPVIVNDTIYVGNAWDWLFAIPLSAALST